MITYQLAQPSPLSGNTEMVQLLGSDKWIPFDPDNTDYQAFKQNLANGVDLSDAEGTVMTADQIKTFLETLS